MGWRTAAGQMAAGTYDVPGDQEGAGFASGFAAAFVPALNDAVDGYVSEQREKRLLELKESLLRQRPRSSSTTAADRKTAEELRDINSLAATLGVSAEEAAGLYYSADGDVSMAVNAYDENMIGGLYVTPVDLPEEPAAPATPEATGDQQSSLMPNEAPVADTAPVADVASVATDNLEATQPTSNFNDDAAFQVASLGSIADDMALKGTEGEDDLETKATQIAAGIETEVKTAVEDGVLVADASGQVPVLDYATTAEQGLTPTEVRAVGTRIPQYYRIPEPATITTLGEANAALDVLEARREYIGQEDGYYLAMKPLLEQRVGSLTELPDLGAYLQENQRDKLQEFFEFGYQAYEGKVDPAQLQAHRDRAGELLQQSNSMPEIPTDLEGLRNMRNRVNAGEFSYMPLEWYEQLNTATRTAELQTRYGDKLSVDYIMDDARTDRELRTLRSATVAALGEDSPIVRDIDVALGDRIVNPDPLEPYDYTKVEADSFNSQADIAAQMGYPDTVVNNIRALGQEKADAAANGTTEPMSDQISTVMSIINPIETTIREVNNQADAFVGLVQSAQSLDQIVQSNPGVTYSFGGELAGMIERGVGEIQAFRGLLQSDQDISIDVGTALGELDRYERNIEASLTSGTINQLAHDNAIFEAQTMRLAFQLARLQQGPAGVISNQDFQSAIDQIRASRQAGTFQESLRGLISLQETNITTALNSLAQNRAVKAADAAQQAFGFEEKGLDFTEGVARPLDQRFQEAGLSDAYAWLKGQPAPAEGAATQATSAAGTQANPIAVSSPDEAAALDAGLYYKTPDGRIFKR